MVKSSSKFCRFDGIKLVVCLDEFSNIYVMRVFKANENSANKIPYVPTLSEMLCELEVELHVSAH